MQQLCAVTEKTAVYGAHKFPIREYSNRQSFSSLYKWTGAFAPSPEVVLAAPIQKAKNLRSLPLFFSATSGQVKSAAYSHSAGVAPETQFSSSKPVVTTIFTP